MMITSCIFEHVLLVMLFATIIFPYPPLAPPPLALSVRSSSPSINMTLSENSYTRSSQVIAQYHQFIRLGFEGYKHIMENCWDNARTLRKGVDRTGRFNITSKDIGVPLVAFSLNDSSQHTVFEIADQLRNFGSIVPAYTMPPDAQHITVLRVVVREDFNHGLAERLAADIDKVVKLLDTLPSLTTKAARVTAITSETDEKKIKKIAVETQRDIAVYWKRLVKGKRHGAC